jgi:DNA-binding PadR family transcriptional regulator
MNTKTLCLAILSTREASGYEIKKLVQEGIFSHFVDASFGSIYPALGRMEQEGLVGVREHYQPGKPPSKIYSITDDGTDELIAALSAPAKQDIHKSEFLMVAMFAPSLRKDVVAKAIAAQRAYYEAELATIHEHQETGTDCPDSPGGDWVAEYGKRVLGQALAYLNENEQKLLDIAGTETLQSFSEAAE